MATMPRPTKQPLKRRILGVAFSRLTA